MSYCAVRALENPAAVCGVLCGDPGELGIPWASPRSNSGVCGNRAEGREAGPTQKTLLASVPDVRGAQDPREKLETLK